MVNQVDEPRLIRTSKSGIEWQKQSGPFADFDVTESEVLFSFQRACHQWTLENMNRRAQLTKLERLKNGNAPRVLDLFAGCGGFSLGFAAAGYEIIGAVEVDPLAAKSHALNFCRGFGARQFAAQAKPRDITSVEPEELVRVLSLGKATGAIDVIIGGPPCQGFARVGRAELHEIASHPKAF